MPDSALQSQMFCQRETLDLGFLMQRAHAHTHAHTKLLQAHKLTNMPIYLFIWLNTL